MAPRRERTVNLLRGRDFAVLAIKIFVLAITTRLLLVTFLFPLPTIVARLHAGQPQVLYSLTTISSILPG
jgi:hypothetical protein